MLKVQTSSTQPQAFITFSIPERAAPEFKVATGALPQLIPVIVATPITPGGLGIRSDPAVCVASSVGITLLLSTTASVTR